MADDAALILAIVRDEHALLALRGGWEQLVSRAAPATPFMDFDWIECGWRRHRDAPDARPHVVIVRNGGRLVLAAPFCARKAWFGLSWLGWIDSRMPVYNDIVMEDSDTGRAARALMWRHVVRDPRIYRLRLNWVRDDAAISPCLAEARARRTVPVQSPYIDLKSFTGWEDYLGQLGQNLRGDHRRRVRRLAEQGMSFRILTRWEEIEPVFGWLMEHKREWVERTQGLDPWFVADGTEPFLREVARRAALRGETWLALLQTRRGIAAAALFFCRGGTLYLSKMTYDPATTRESPGRTVIMLAIREAFERGLERADLMIGNPAWKQRITPDIAGVASYKVRAGLLRRAP